MIAIVSLLSDDDQRIVASFREIQETFVWVLGDIDAGDANTRSLPRMTPQDRDALAVLVKNVLDKLPAALLHVPTTSTIDGSILNAAAKSILERHLLESMALVFILTAVDSMFPIELVLIDDDLTPTTRTATQWALSKHVPAVRIARHAQLGRPIASEAERISPHVVAYGERGRLASVDAGITPARVATFPRPGPPTISLNATLRAAQRNILADTYGVSAHGPLITFAAPGFTELSAFMRRDRYDMSLRVILAAFVLVRRSIPSVQLMLVDVLTTREATQHAARIAEALGLDASDYAYAPSEAAGSIAAADVVVSLDSSRSLDAALAGVAAINLWTKQSWYLGPYFSATDGVIEVVPEDLAPALIMLLDPSTAAQTVAMSQATLVPAFGGTPNVSVAANIANHISKLPRARRPTESSQIAKRQDRTPDILIHAPQSPLQSFDVRYLFRLAHFMNLLGANATMSTSFSEPEWNAPVRTKPITEKTIVIYPETVAGNLFRAARVVRYFLTARDRIEDTLTRDGDEMAFYHPASTTAFPAAIARELRSERAFELSVIEPDLFFHDRSLAKTYDCVYVGRACDMQQRLQLPQLEDAFLIQRGSDMWPPTRAETALLLRGCRNLYLYDRTAAISVEAFLCGVTVFYINEDGTFEPVDFSGLPHEQVVEAFFDPEQARRLLDLLTERWP